MSNEPFYSPNHRPARRQAQPGEHLWAIRKKDGRQIDCELRDHGSYGVELQLLRDLAWFYGHRWPTRELARAEADELRAKYLGEGGVLIG